MPQPRITPFLLRLAQGMLLLLVVAGSASAQISLTSGVQTYSSLTSTTVTLTGQSELRLTASTAVLTGCTLQLNSTDAYLVFTAVRPSTVLSTYLSQVQVSGAAAVNGTNCRVTQYGEGTIILAHPAGFAPMTVFTSSHFQGTATTLTPYTAYTDSSLGSNANNIASFKLKRGYTATVAQNSNGTGVSRNYVAQDGDIEVAVLPAELDDTISFIRIFPWRWVSKKGIAGNINSGLGTSWWYNWNLDQNSSADQEYVPIRQERWWPSLSQNWQTRGATHLLGYNEPDHADQANMAVGDAIYSWPDLLGTGLRVGSPAPTDGGLSWLYSFMSQAAAADHRVDFVAVHYYRGFSSASDPVGAANQFYNFLKGVHDTTGKAIWVTEFNNGANWTTTPDPTAAQQAATVDAMLDMLESTPWVERYSLYNWVEDVRRVKWDDGSLTQAGIIYRDHPTSIGYQQVIPPVETAPAALYRFENNTRDSLANGHISMLNGAPTYTPGHTGQAITLSGSPTSQDHVHLSPRIGDSTDFTFGAWVYWNGGGNWQRIFDLGSSTTSYLFLTPNAGSGMRFAIRDGGTDQQLNTSALPTGAWTHIAVTISGSTGKLFVNGSLVSTNNSMTLNPSDVGSWDNYLGRSQFTADPYFNGKLDDVTFLPYALSDSAITTLQTNNPPSFTPSSSLTRPAGVQGVAYTATLSGTATDPDAGDSLSYSKVEGPAWLTVAADGSLTGTPTLNDDGPQTFIIYATDSSGATAVATLSISLPTVTGSATWSVDSSGTWGDTSKWSTGQPANGTGFTANFNALNISADRVVTLDSTRTIGHLTFADTVGTQSWTLAANSGRTLTLAVSSGSPSISTSAGTTTSVNAALGGTAGLNKLGTGHLTLGGANTLSGVFNIDTGSTSTAEGRVRLAHPGAAGSITSIPIRTNNSGSSTLELDAVRGLITTPASITLSGRAGTVPAITNISGDNTLQGGLTITSGGGTYTLQADAGLLTLEGPVTSAATGTRVLTFGGAGSYLLTGIVSNGSATTGVGIVKNGAGSLTMSGANTFSLGTITLNGGSLTTAGSTFAPSTVTLATGTVWNNSRTTTLASPFSGSGTYNSTASHTITADFSGFTGVFTHNSSTVSIGFNSGISTSRSASYSLLSTQGSAQGFVVGGSGDYTLEMGSLSGVPGSLFRGGFSATGTTTLQVGNLNTSTTFAGNISNGTNKILALTKVGTGSLTLTAPCSYTGATQLHAGRLILSSTFTSSISSTGGTLAPQGTPTTTGALTQGSGSTYQTRIETTGSDSLTVATSISLSGGLDLVPGTALPAGTTYILLSKTSAGAISGTFTGLPEGSVFSQDGYVWKVSYIGGDGNDLTVTLATPIEAWRHQNFASISNNDSLDTDGDGLPNLLEYAFLTSPGASNAAPTQCSRDAGTMDYTFTRNSSATDITTTVEWSDDITTGTWSTSSVTLQMLSDNGSTQQWKATLPAGTAQRRFVRLKVTRP